MKVYSGGINLNLPPWDAEVLEKKQCVWMQGIRYKEGRIICVPGTRKYHNTAVSGSITALMPYYNDQNDKYALLVAAGDVVYKKNEETNELVSLKGGFHNDSIYSSTMRYDVMYIATTSDGLWKYLGGEQLERVGANDTKPGNFRIIVYMKEIDRLFGISEDAIYGQISWSNISDPETWDGANTQRIKLQDGERVEGATVLYGKLVIFTTYNVWILWPIGNEENWKLEQAPTTVGCVAPNSIRHVGREIWYLGESPRYSLGVYAFDGSSSRLLTKDVSRYLARANKHKLRNAAAEIHDDIYQISFALDSSVNNNVTLDLDTVELTAEGSPAIYGPHEYGFSCSCVLNNRQRSKEFLRGTEDGGYVLKCAGDSLNENEDGSGGSLIRRLLKTPVYIDDGMHIVKQYDTVDIFYAPSGFVDCFLKVYISSGQALAVQSETWRQYPSGFAGNFDVFEDHLIGFPLGYHHQERLSTSAFGTSVQFEISCDTIRGRMELYGIDYKSRSLYESKQVIGL